MDTLTDRVVEYRACWVSHNAKLFQQDYDHAWRYPKAAEVEDVANLLGRTVLDLEEIRMFLRCYARDLKEDEKNQAYRLTQAGA